MSAWWRHEMETFSALLAICAGNSPVPGQFPTQRPVTRSFDIFFGLRLNKRLSKQSWGWWFQTISLPLWCHYTGLWMLQIRRAMQIWCLFVLSWYSPDMLILLCDTCGGCTRIDNEIERSRAFMIINRGNIRLKNRQGRLALFVSWLLH